MKAMILAAGRGERLRPLTDKVPKPLVKVGGKALIEWQLEKLKDANFNDVVINVAYLGDEIERALGDGSRFRLRIHYSRELDGALESGGGIVKALPLLGSDPFVLLNSDIWTDFDLSRLSLPDGRAGHLVLVDNPGHKRQGDFSLSGRTIANVGAEKLTYTGIAVLTAGLFADCKPERFPLVPVLRRAAESGLLSGERYNGAWFDAGTPDRLQALRTYLESVKG